MQVPFVLNGPAKLTLTVTRGRRVVAKVTSTRRRGGRGSLAWNGRVNRKAAARGSYKITLRAVPTTGAVIRDTATLRIV